MTGTLRHKSPTVKSIFEGYTLEMGTNWRKVLSDNLKELRGDRSQQSAVGKKMLVRTYSRLEALDTDATLSSIVAAADAYSVTPWQLLQPKGVGASNQPEESLPAFAQAYIQGEIEQIKAALEGMPEVFVRNMAPPEDPAEYAAWEDGIRQWMRKDKPLRPLKEEPALLGSRKAAKVKLG